MDGSSLQLALKRLIHALFERHVPFETVTLVGQDIGGSAHLVEVFDVLVFGTHRHAGTTANGLSQFLALLQGRPAPSNLNYRVPLVVRPLLRRVGVQAQRQVVLQHVCHLLLLLRHDVLVPES